MIDKKVTGRPTTAPQFKKIMTQLFKNMNTIRMQLIGEYLYPTDSWSRDTLFELTNHDRFKKDMLDLLSPRLIKKGYRLAISNYN